MFFKEAVIALAENGMQMNETWADLERDNVNLRREKKHRLRDIR